VIKTWTPTSSSRYPPTPTDNPIRRRDLLTTERTHSPRLGGLGDAALALAELGVAVFPTLPGRNEGRYCYRDATTDELKIRLWWTREPNSNIGCVYRIPPDAEGRQRIKVIIVGVGGY
jgi:hypothetical protein